MIEAKNLMKSFEDIKAIDDISLEIREGNVFGLIGTNGAGKSTFMRMMTGILKPDAGEVKIDGETVFENVDAKKKIFYISDDQFFFQNATPMDMCSFYSKFYTDLDKERFKQMMNSFDLDSKRRINTFSKGMKKQLSIILGICAGTKYLFCDETFDGLDPVMRQGVKSIFAAEMEDRDFTPVIASHNLRELEDICDHVGLLHKGGVLLSKDLIELKTGIHKVQFVLNESVNVDEVLGDLDILIKERRGSLNTMTIRGDEEEIMRRIRGMNPVFAESLPLSLEEIFISETGVIGYDIKKLIF